MEQLVFLSSPLSSHWQADGHLAFLTRKQITASHGGNQLHSSLLSLAVITIGYSIFFRSLFLLHKLTFLYNLCDHSLKCAWVLTYPFPEIPSRDTLSKSPAPRLLAFVALYTLLSKFILLFHGVDNSVPLRRWKLREVDQDSDVVNELRGLNWYLVICRHLNPGCKKIQLACHWDSRGFSSCCLYQVCCT